MLPTKNCCVDSFVSWLYLLFIYVAVCLSRWCFCLTHCQRIYFMSLHATLRGSYLKKSPKTQTNHPHILRSLVFFCIPALKQAAWILVGLFTSQVELIVIVTLLQTCGWTIGPRWKVKGGREPKTLFMLSERNAFVIKQTLFIVLSRNLKCSK